MVVQYLVSGSFFLVYEVRSEVLRKREREREREREHNVLRSGDSMLIKALSLLEDPLAEDGGRVQDCLSGKQPQTGKLQDAERDLGARGETLPNLQPS